MIKLDEGSRPGVVMLRGSLFIRFVGTGLVRYLLADPVVELGSALLD